MAPKKEKAQKFSLNEFMKDDSLGGGGGNWADEVEETYGTQPLPATDRQRGTYSSSYSRGDGGFGGTDRFAGYARQEREELPIPDKPPYTAHLGNLSYDANQEAVTDFFTSAGCEVVNVRIVEDRAEMRPKGFGYAEFATPDDLRKALGLNEESFFNRNIRIRVADPPKDRYGNESNRDFSDWSRKGPLPDIPSRQNNRGPRDFNDAREPREFREPREPRAAGPDYSQMSWERKGPLSPAVAAPVMERGGSRTGSRSGHRMTERTNSFANRGASPAAWGPSEGRQESRQESRPPREAREPRAPTAAEQEFDWRAKMRPDASAAKSPVTSRAGSEAPPSPALPPAAPAAPAGRPRLNLQKRTVSEAPGVMSPSLASESKASPFGAARPIDTAAREREIAEKKQKELQEKKEAEEKAKEEKRLAKEAAAKEASEKAAAEATAEDTAQGAAEGAAEDTEPNGKPADVDAAAPETTDAGNSEETNAETAQNGVDGSEQKIPIRRRESSDSRAEAPKSSRAGESGNWRSAGPSRGAPRGPRSDRGDRRGGGAPRGGQSFENRQPSRKGSDQRRGSEQQPSTPTTQAVDPDGWTTVSGSAKGRRGGRPVPS